MELDLDSGARGGSDVCDGYSDSRGGRGGRGRRGQDGRIRNRGVEEGDRIQNFVARRCVQDMMWFINYQRVKASVINSCC